MMAGKHWINKHGYLLVDGVPRSADEARALRRSADDQVRKTKDKRVAKRRRRNKLAREQRHKRS